MRRLLIGSGLSCLLTVAVAGCDNPGGPGPATSVTVVPASETLAPGETVALVALAVDEQGRQAGGAINWSTSNSDVARVEASTGLVTAVNAGVATITAFSGTASGTATVVVEVPLSSITPHPQSAALVLGGSLQLTAYMLDAGGSPVGGNRVTWTSGNPAVATVDSTGLVHGMSLGAAEITATSGGRAGVSRIQVVAPVASVTITPPNPILLVGATGPLTAEIRDAAGNPLDREVTWTSSDSATVTVSATGVARGVAVGSAIITATAGGVSGSTQATVVMPLVGGFLQARYPLGTRSLRADDLNGDGRPDLVAASGTGVAIAYGVAGRAMFTPPETYPASTGTAFPSILSLDVGDLNGDGRPDIVAVDNSSSLASVFYRRPDNSGFAPAVNYPIGGPGPTSVAIGDLNGDGRADLAIAAYQYFRSNLIAVLYRRADHIGFEAPVLVPLGTSPKAVDIGDLDGDGNADLAAAHEGPFLTLTMRNVAGTGFEPAVRLPLTRAASNVRIADLNGDGRLDLFVMYLEGGCAALYRSPDGSYSLVDLPDGSLGGWMADAGFGDLNGDGRLDVAVGTVEGAAVLYRNVANSGYDPPVHIPIVAGQSSSRPAIVADLNVDGRLDVAALDGAGNLQVMLRP